LNKAYKFIGIVIENFDVNPSYGNNYRYENRAKIGLFSACFLPCFYSQNATSCGLRVLFIVFTTTCHQNHSLHMP